MEKFAVITGVSKGLGRALSEEFKKHGYKIIGISRNRGEANPDYFIPADLTKKEDIDRIFTEITKITDKVDVLINNAGIGIYEKWENISEEDLRKVFELNFFAVVFLTQKLLPLLKKSKGTIINVSSVAGKIYVPYMGAYCTTKYALNAFSDSLRAELQKDNVHVLNLIVGRISTGFSSRALGSRKPPETPAGSATPEDFAKAVYKAFIQKKREITYPWWYKPLIWLANKFPSIYDSKVLEKWESQDSV